MLEEKIERLTGAIESLVRAIHLTADAEILKQNPLIDLDAEANEIVEEKPKAKKTKAKKVTKDEPIASVEAPDKKEPEIDLFGDTSAVPVTEDDIRKAAMELVKLDGNTENATGIISRFGVKHICDLKPEAFSEILEKFKEAIAAKER